MGTFFSPPHPLLPGALLTLNTSLQVQSYRSWKSGNSRNYIIYNIVDHEKSWDIEVQSLVTADVLIEAWTNYIYLATSNWIVMRGNFWWTPEFVSVELIMSEMYIKKQTKQIKTK